MENEISLTNIFLFEMVLRSLQKNGNEAAYLNNTDVPARL